MGTVGLSSTVLTVQTLYGFWKKLSIVPQVTSAQGKNTLRGQCWFAMVRNPVIATDYPVPWRDDASLYKGLEVSLDLMVAMSRAEFPTMFGGKFMLKGVMSALFPTSASDYAIMWHFMINPGEFSTLAVNSTARPLRQEKLR
jgi:hypothetical protein